MAWTQKMREVRSGFDVVLVTDNAIYIKDLNLGRMSVTNDAENVVRDVLRRYCEGRLRAIFYLDSEGDWAELVHDGKRFIGFASANGPVALREVLS